MIGEKIKQLRCEKNMTAEELARALKVSLSCVCKWETNRNTPTFPRRREICKFFEVEPEYFGWEANPEPTTILGQFLLKERTERGCMPAEFARELGVRPCVYQNWESGRWLPKLPELIKLSNLTERSVEELTTGNTGFLYDLFPPEQAYELLGKRIKEYREREGMSARQFGIYIGASPTIIRAYEVAEIYPTIKRIHMMAEVFECTVDEFLSVEGVE